VIALNSSSIDCVLSGDQGSDVTAVEAALTLRQGVFPVVVTELLSDPAIRPEVKRLIVGVPRLETAEGY
jgi:hypothetical protein